MTGRTALVLRHDSAIGLGNLGPTLSEPAANAASAALLGEYLDGLAARKAAERRSA